MQVKRFFRALASGVTLPSIIIPLSYAYLNFFYPNSIKLFRPTYISPLYIPILFGFTNVIYARFSSKLKENGRDNLLILCGVGLGIIVSTMHIPTYLFGVTNAWHDKSIIVLPLFYAIMFRFIIKWSNKTLGLDS